MSSTVDLTSTASPGAPTADGDAAIENANLAFQAGDLAFVAICTFLIFLMIPGAGLFYSGLSRRKSALSVLLLSGAAAAVSTFQWFIWGYSLVFSHTAGRFIAGLTNAGFRHVLASPSANSARIPDIQFATFESMFAAVTAALAIGAVADRGRIFPALVFIFIWSTIVYDPIACWSWNKRGWAATMGALDFAGGTPVHITAGATALAYSYMLGRRAGHGTQELNFRPHNVAHIVIGTVFLAFGWFGFNAGSALGANVRALVAATATQLSGCVGGLTWIILDFRLERKWSAVGFCSGVVSGLVAITPAAGFISPWAAVVIGFVGAVGSNYATKIKYHLGCDDALDIFAVHAIGGLIGNIMTAFFADPSIARLDGQTVIKGGWVAHHWVQLGYQLAGSVAGLAYAFVVSSVILWFIGSVLGRFVSCSFRLRLTEQEERQGMDEIELGEFVYDYVDVVQHPQTKITSRTHSLETPPSSSALKQDPISEPVQPNSPSQHLGAQPNEKEIITT